VLTAEVANRIVLRVNDRIATLVDFQQLYGEQIRMIMSRSDLDREERERLIQDAGPVIMRGIFDNLLILSRADQLGVSVTDIDVAEAIDSIRERNGLEDDDQFRTALAQSGMTLADLRRQMELDLMRQEVMGREVAPRTRVEEDEVRRYYREHPEQFQVPEQIKLKEVVILEEESSQEEMHDLTAEIHDSLLEGQTLEDVAERYAPKVSSVLDLDWISRGDLDPALEASVWDLEANHYSEPTPARGGVHIVHLLERKPAFVLPFTDVQDRIYARERGRKFDVEYELYLKELEDKSFVRGRVPEEARGFRTASGRAVTDDEAFPFLPKTESAEDELAPRPESEPSSDSP
jgi:parvulin-like peptidyl-prolyl isomerase